MSDAQYDGGDRGQAAEDRVGGWIGDLDDAQAMYWYGSFNLIVGIGAMFAWIFFNDEWAGVARWSMGFQYHFYFFLPVGITWFLSLFIQDNETLLGILKRLVIFGVFGPFYQGWYAWADYLWMWHEDMGLMYYLWGAAWFTSVIVEEIVQILIVPQVLNYIDGGKYEDENGDRDRIHNWGVWG